MVTQQVPSLAFLSASVAVGTCHGGAVGLGGSVVIPGRHGCRETLNFAPRPTQDDAPLVHNRSGFFRTLETASVERFFVRARGVLQANETTACFRVLHSEVLGVEDIRKEKRP